MARIAFLGTGIMGGHMARRLAAAGFEVAAWNRSADKTAALSPHGVIAAASVADALRGADAAVVMVSTGAVVDELLFGADSPLGGWAAQSPASGGWAAQSPASGGGTTPGRALLVMSSIPVESARRQAQAAAALGIRYLDAPVSGGEPGARDGTLAILVGGEREAFEQAQPLFAALGRATLLGPAGSGQLAKLANQIIVGGTLVAIAEALTLVQQGGADPAAVREALMGGFGDSKVMRVLGERMVNGNFVPGSPAAYQLKDMRTAATLAAGMGLDLQLLQHLIGTFEQLLPRGEDQSDVSIVLREVARRSGAAHAA